MSRSVHMGHDSPHPSPEPVARTIAPPSTTRTLKTSTDHARFRNLRRAGVRESFTDRSILSRYRTPQDDYEIGTRLIGYDSAMKKVIIGLLVLAAAAGLGVVAYRTMTVEVPVEDQN